MPPYKPPNAHYAHVKVDYSDDDVFEFIGTNGWRFKELTHTLGVYYIYYHPRDKIVSVHGPWESMTAWPALHVQHEIDKFLLEKGSRVSDDDCKSDNEELVPILAKGDC